MKRINFNIKDRKFLITTLSLAIVCIFTLTIAYSALSAVLTINGHARVSAADWDIYLDNPRVTGGSATTDIPIVNGVTATFNTTLNMPGDFYEFVVDVVNDGDIDAMIENVVKTPELTTEQAKFLKYEITYQNNEPITTKQLLAKDTTMPIKVRIEYRNDLVSSDLPTGQVILDLALTLEYIQSDGTGSSVTDNGIYDPYKIGNEKCFGSECFYVLSSTEDTVTMLAKYNLYVGAELNNTFYNTYGEEATGMQDSTMLGRLTSSIIYRGVTPFSNDSPNYSGSIIEGYVNNYKEILENNFDIDVIEARLITYDELSNPDTFACEKSSFCSNTSYSWIYSTTYWTGSAYSDQYIYGISNGGYFGIYEYNSKDIFGVRPVIVISKDYFN